ncbi:MAG: hypothetical protein HC902_02460 [Calothrix sp. SM1_5_4]|nr:hypothetical protein [Calothrix sp. SM1_5_4]
MPGFALSGCGVGLEDSSDADTARSIKNDKLRGEYEAIKGTYEGFIRIRGVERLFPVRFFLFWGEVQEQPFPGDLRPGLRVVLRGRLMQTEFIGDSDNLILTGQFDGATGRLNLDPDSEFKTSSAAGWWSRTRLTIAGSIRGEAVNAAVLRNGQEWARFENVRRVNREVATGSVLSEDEEFRRLQQVYSPVAGMYRGSLSRNVCGGDVRREDDFQLWIYVDRHSEGGGASGGSCYIPRLVARTLRSVAGELADVRYRSISRFDPQTFFAPVPVGAGQSQHEL